MAVYLQIRTRAVSCKQMTMVNAIQLLLAARSVKYDGEFVVLDNWSVLCHALIPWPQTTHSNCNPLRINLQMSAHTAASLVALRPALEALIVKATSEPEGIQEPSPLDSELMNLIRALSRVNSASYGLEERTQAWVSPFMLLH